MNKKPAVPLELEKLLKRRGLEVLSWSTPKDLLLPKGLQRQRQFYERLKNYSFRLVLRDIIKHQEAFRPQDLTRFCSVDKVEEYLVFLYKLGLIRENKKGYRLTGQPVRSLGDTLEWFVARIFTEEFEAEAIWGIRFKNSTFGGDYDVVARMGDDLVYVEVKSSPPKNIEQKDVQGFFNRIEDLLPHLAIFFVDTELRMKDKMVPLFEEELRSRHGDESLKSHAVIRLRDELFQINHQLFIVNSKRDIVSNFRDCFRDYWRSLIRL